MCIHCVTAHFAGPVYFTGIEVTSFFPLAPKLQIALTSSSKDRFCLLTRAVTIQLVKLRLAQEQSAAHW